MGVDPAPGEKGIGWGGCERRLTTHTLPSSHPSTDVDRKATRHDACDVRKEACEAEEKGNEEGHVVRSRRGEGDLPHACLRIERFSCDRDRSETHRLLQTPKRRSKDPCVRGEKNASDRSASGASRLSRSCFLRQAVARVGCRS